MLSHLLFLVFPVLVLCWVTDMEQGRDLSLGTDLTEGDIILSPEQIEEVKSGGLSYKSMKEHLWPKRIPYKFSISIARSAKAVRSIREAIKEYEKYTCLRFHPRQKEDNYILFYRGVGCSSPVGVSRNRTRNAISLAYGCWSKSTVIHEIGHSLGFYHEQSRPDRAKYLNIYMDNVVEEKRHNFEIAKTIDSSGSPYDYLSVMHYDKTAFGNGKITIEPINKYYLDLIGTGSGLSQIDIEQINNLYKCPVYTGELPLVPTPQCHDSSRYCTLQIGRWGCNKVGSWCRISCGLCKPKRPTRPPITTIITTTITATTTTTTQSSTTTPKPSDVVLVEGSWPCQDYDSRCTHRTHLCGKVPWVRLLTCQLSCGTCTTPHAPAPPPPLPTSVSVKLKRQDPGLKSTMTTTATRLSTFDTTKKTVRKSTLFIDKVKSEKHCSQWYCKVVSWMGQLLRDLYKSTYKQFDKLL